MVRRFRVEDYLSIAARRLRGFVLWIPIVSGVVMLTLGFAAASFPTGGYYDNVRAVLEDGEDAKVSYFRAELPAWVSIQQEYGLLYGAGWAALLVGLVYLRLKNHAFKKEGERETRSWAHWVADRAWEKEFYEREGRDLTMEEWYTWHNRWSEAETDWTEMAGRPDTNGRRGTRRTRGQTGF
jgi:hypothetical protein